MICRKCGNNIPDSSAFCPACGAPQQGRTPPPGCNNRGSNNTGYSNTGYNSTGYSNTQYNNTNTGYNNTAYNAGYSAQTSAQKTSSYNTLCIVGLVISCLSLWYNVFGIVGLAGTIVSAVGLYKCKQNNEKGNILAIIGIVIGAISILRGIYSIIVLSFSYNIWSRIMDFFFAGMKEIF